MAFSHYELKEIIEDCLPHWDEEDTLELQNILIEIEENIGIESISLTPEFYTPDNNKFTHTPKSFIITDNCISPEQHEILFSKLSGLIDNVMNSFSIWKNSDIIILELNNY